MLHAVMSLFAHAMHVSLLLSSFYYQYLSSDYSSWYCYCQCYLNCYYYCCGGGSGGGGGAAAAAAAIDILIPRLSFRICSISTSTMIIIVGSCANRSLRRIETLHEERPQIWPMQ